LVPDTPIADRLGRPVRGNKQAYSYIEEKTMLILGVLLLLAAVALGVAAVGGGSGTVNFDVLNNTIESTGAQAFLVGAAAGVAAVVGLWLIRRGSRGAYSRRRELRQLRRSQRDQRAADERAEREREQTDREQTDREQTDREQTDREQTDREQTDREKAAHEEV
jgi:hypothetical protein